MNFPRVKPYTRIVQRIATALALSTAVLSLSATSAAAESKYPSQPIRIVVPFGVGGLADITMRMVAKEMSLRFGENIIIDNRPGAGGIVAANVVLSAPRDGYTIALFANGTAIAKSLFKLPYDAEKDFTPISRVVYFDLLVLANGSGNIKSLQDLIELSHKRQIALGSINAGSTQNLSTELFKSTTKMNAIVVPYRNTGDVISGLVRGDIDAAFESYAAVKGSIGAGQIRALAATGATRSAWLPDVPTVAQAGVQNYEVTGWNALFAASGTPQADIDVLNHQLNEVLASPALKTELHALGTEPMGSTPAEMAKIFHDDAVKWSAVIARTGIKPQ
jgi:tripartite-type tricarboxylate transporter receptor subunit TctC